MGDGNSKYSKPDYKYYDSYNNVQHVMKFVHSCFCVIERQCKCFPFFECINLKQKEGQSSWFRNELSKNIKQRHCSPGGKEASVRF